MHFIIRTIAIIGVVLLSQMAHADVLYSVVFSTAEIDGKKLINIADIAVMPMDATKESSIKEYDAKFKQAKPDRFELFKDKQAKFFASNAEAKAWRDDLIEKSKSVEFTVEYLGAGATQKQEAEPTPLSSTAWPFNTSEAKKRQSEASTTYNLDVEKNANNNDFILIPPGEFMMGSVAEEEGRNADEVMHLVKISKPFYLAKDESMLPGNTYVEVTQWLAKLQAKAPAGFAFRLPTEAEWEYAARAGKATAYYTGDHMYGAQYESIIENHRYRYEIRYSDGSTSFLSGDGALSAKSPATVTHNGNTFHLYLISKMEPEPKRGFAANAWGLYDIPGRLSELVEDRYAPYAKQSTAQIDPMQKSGTGHVIRGGNFKSNVGELRSAARKYVDDAKLNSNSEFETVGVRLVMFKLED